MRNFDRNLIFDDNDFFEKKNLPAANSTSIESVDEPDMFNLRRGVKFSIFCIFIFSDLRSRFCVNVAYYLKMKLFYEIVFLQK